MLQPATTWQLPPALGSDEWLTDLLDKSPKAGGNEDGEGDGFKGLNESQRQLKALEQMRWLGRVATEMRAWEYVDTVEVEEKKRKKRLMDNIPAVAQVTFRLV